MVPQAAGHGQARICMEELLSQLEQAAKRFRQLLHGMGFTVKVRGAFTPTIAPNTGGTIYLNGVSCGLNKSIVGSGLTTAMAVFQYSAAVTWDVDAFGFTCVP